MNMFAAEPLTNVMWKKTADLNANDYNPNVVFNKELELLELSILKNGWIQPVLIDQNNTIIDGFHRWRLSTMSKALIDKYAGYVPCVVLDLPEGERIMLTVRINRAKGSHVAIKMAELVDKLVSLGYSLEAIALNIGATREEVELLYQNDIFKRKDVQNKKYSRAWYPKA